MKAHATVLAIVVAVTAPRALAVPGECTARSGPLKNALVELYTSEGCSSCPPADRWLSAFAPPGAQPQVIPLAFHIGYWDYIGWKDAFADARFTARQRALAVAAKRSGVYTPQVIVDGRDFPEWRSGATPSAIGAVSRSPAKATIEMTRSFAGPAITGEVKVDVASRMSTPSLQLVVVLTESRLGSRVTAGENRGETLRHDFVARDMATFRVKDGAAYPVRFEGKPGWKPADTRLVAFVQDAATSEVWQALASCPF